MIQWLLISSLTVFLASCQPADPRRVIIHADDAGMSASVNKATIEGLERGIVSSVSIMVPCPAFEEFAEYARSHPERDFGIHLTLNSEWDNYRWGPVSPPEQVPSLIDEEGYFWKTTTQVAKHADVAEVEIELRAQIERAKESGVRLTHLDTHMFAMLSRRDLAQLYVDLGIEYDLPILMLRTLDESMKRARPGITAIHPRVVERLDAQKLPILDRLEADNYSVPASEKRSYFLNHFRTLGPGVTEVLIHCGFNDLESQDFRDADRREADYRIFTSLELKEEINDLGITVITWKQFHAMAAAPNK